MQEQENRAQVERLIRKTFFLYKRESLRVIVSRLTVFLSADGIPYTVAEADRYHITLQIFGYNYRIFKTGDGIPSFLIT